MGAPGVDWLGLYLMEDLGAGDRTSDPLLPASAQGKANIVARQPLVAAGLRHARDVFARLGADGVAKVREGASVERGTVLMVVSGPARAILSGERLALNIIGRMSGIATTTRACMARLSTACSAATVAATRKTTPGFRVFEKEAVVLGGGEAHRGGLWDEPMLKDNHLEAFAGRPLAQVPAGQVAAAVAAVAAANPGQKVCCEVETLDHALAAAAAGAHWLLIDNQAPEVGQAWAKAVAQRHPQVRFEASGGVTPDNVADFGWADRISLGWLTQKSPAADVALDWQPEGAA